jgi:hypothetical protein
MVAADFLNDMQVRRWLNGVDPAWTLLTFDSLRALQQEPSAVQTSIRVANDLDGDEIMMSAVARNTLRNSGLPSSHARCYVGLSGFIGVNLIREASEDTSL